VVKIRLQQQRGLAKEQLKYKGPVHCAMTTLKEEGIRGMWSGAGGQGGLLWEVGGQAHCSAAACSGGTHSP